MSLVDLFPWAPGEIQASLASCPPGALHITGVRLERLGPDAWWADVTGYRADLDWPLTWQGFRIRRHAATGWEITPPPYLADLGGHWCALVLGTIEAAVSATAADPSRAGAGIVAVTIECPPGVPAPPGAIGGDRITPGETFTGIWVHHAKRYRFAAALAAGRAVLDLGSGVGYGTRMLGRAARWAVGVDISPEAVAHAARAWHGPRTAFLAADACRLPFADRAFGLVACFEMIEHVEDQAAVLTEAARVLGPDGQLVISTPNKVFYEDQPDPEGFHRGLLTREEFERLLRAHFGDVELWSQRRLQRLPEITDEFEIEPGAHDSQEMFVAVASAPRSGRAPLGAQREPSGASGLSPAAAQARRQIGRREDGGEPLAAPGAAPKGSAGGGGDGLRILVFNWHEPYLALLARAGFQWAIADWHRPWNRHFRPLPLNARLVSDPAAADALLDERRVDLVLGQTLQDLRWLGERDMAMIYLAHNSLPNEVRGREPGAAAEVRDLVRQGLARRGGRFVAISEMKLESWGLDGVAIPPGLDPEEYGGYTGETSSALTVANLLAERAHMLGFAELGAGLDGLPWQILGTNPTLGTREAEGWDALKAAYRAHRFYAHATLWPWEDGYNLALLEAMASGMPVVAWANPTSPIRSGVEGFVAEDAEAFRHWACRLLDDPDLARRVGARARRAVAECFPLDAFVGRWRTVLLDAANRPAAVHAVAPGLAPAAPRVAGTERGASETPPDALSGGVRSATGSAAPTAREPGPRRVVLATAWTPISTSTYYARAFRAAGHEVLTWGPHMDEAMLAEWRQANEEHALKAPGHAHAMLETLRGLSRPADIPAAAGQPSVRELLDRLPGGWRPDLFVWIDGGPAFLPLELERLDCPTVCLVGDTHTQLDWRLAYARLYRHVFLLFNKQHVPAFQAGGSARVGWLPAACDPEIHRPFEVAKAFDVVFVGQTHRQWHPHRARLLERLVRAGVTVHVSSAILEEMALAFARGRIVFNRSLDGDLNMRIFEALGTGSFLLTDRLAPESGLDELLTDRAHFVGYAEDDLEALVHHYLAHPAEREAIARSGRAHALAHHTYAHRVGALLDQVFGDAAGPAAPPAELPEYFLNERPEVAQLVPAEARRVLELGCAAGGLGRLLKGTTPREVIGIEINPNAAAVARRHLDRVLTLDLDTAETLPFEPQSFDCIVGADIFEHLRDPERVLTLLRRYLAPGGRLVASIPNVRHAGVLLPLLVEGRWQYRDEGILDRTHLRFFTLTEIIEGFERLGFRVSSVEATRSYEHPAIDRVADAVAGLGGDAPRFKDEASVLQYLVVAELAVPAPAPAVSIVIPVWNRAEFTARCLQALARTIDASEVEVIVVDNGSTDGTPSVLQAAPIPVRVIRNAENLGFARASNQGAGAARGELLVFLNNDTEPEPGWLPALRAVAADPEVGVVGARLLYPATRRLQHAGLALNPDGIPDHLWRNAPGDDPRATEPGDRDMVTGACLAIRRDLFQRLGGFDEGYRNGVEDVDLCLAVRAAGLRVRYEPRAVVLHHEGATEGRFDHAAANLERLVAKWGPTLARLPRRPAEEFGSLPGPTIAWEGSFFTHHSLAGINRALCRELAAAGVDLTLTPYEPDEFDPESAPETRALARLVNRPTAAPPVLRVRHRFPPDFSRRPGERLVVIQPWEFGAVPREWVEAIRAEVHELWVPSEWVRRCYIEGGVPAERVVAIPNGFDPAIFHPGVSPVPLPTARRFRFLYVGGSIYRKGYDALLSAYTEEFTADDDVCLVLKDHAYYRHRLDETLAALRVAPRAPEILYYFDSVRSEQLAGFYTAASCLVHPFRGEGFGLPILEAMACGRPVIVTDAGPVREFCPEDAAIFVPAGRLAFPEARVEHLETAGRPWLADPDVGALRQALRWAYEHSEDLRHRGERAAAHAHAHFTWPTIAARYRARLDKLLAVGGSLGGPSETLGRAAALLEAGDLKGAFPLFARLVQAEPANVPALVGAAHCALGLDEPRVARALLARILQLEPKNDAARTALAILEDIPQEAGR